jgi:hypothetical protein
LRVNIGAKNASMTARNGTKATSIFAVTSDRSEKPTATPMAITPGKSTVWSPPLRMSDIKFFQTMATQGLPRGARGIERFVFTWTAGVTPPDRRARSAASFRAWSTDASAADSSNA